MKEKEFRRNMAVFPIGSVMKLTDLSARQIRYYEDQELIKPEREAKSKKAVSQTEVRRALHNELLQQGRFASVRSPFGRG